MSKLAFVVLLALVAFVQADCPPDATANPPAPSLVITNGQGKQTYLDNNQLQARFASSQLYNSIRFEYLNPVTDAFGAEDCDHVWLRDGGATNTNSWWSDSANQATCDISFVKVIPAASVAAHLTACYAFDNTTDAVRNIYTATVRVTTRQDKGTIRDLPIERVVVTNIQYSFRFQRVITVSTNQVSVIGNNQVESAVVEQIYRPFAVSITAGSVTTDYPAVSTTVRLVTSVQYPYRLNYGINAQGEGSADVTQPPNPSWPFSGPQFIDTYRVTSISPAVAEITNVATDCLDLVGTTCVQLWEVTVTQIRQICDIDTTVGFHFTVDCQPGFQGSCVTAQDTSYSTSYSLSVNHICVDTVQDIGVSGSLFSYADFTHISNDQYTTDFIYGQPAYFSAVLTASAGAPNILSSSVTQVQVASASQTVTFSTPIDSGNNPNNFGVFTTAANRPGFVFDVNSVTVALGNIDSAQSVTVTATITVLFANLQSATKQVTFAVPRFSLQAGNGISLASTIIVASSSTQPATTASSSNTLLAIVAGVVGGCVLVAIIAAIIIYRRTTKSFVSELHGHSAKIMQVYVPAASSSTTNLSADATAASATSAV